MYSLTATSSLPAIINFDTSILSGWYQVQANQSALAAFRASNGGQSPEVTTQGAIEDILPPWDYRQDQVTFDDRLNEAMRAGSIFDTSDPFFNQDMPDEHRDLFKAYKALARLQTLAEYAAKDTTFDGRLPGLDTRFQLGLTELTGFINTLEASSYMLSTGVVDDQADSGFAIARAAYGYTGQIAQSGAYDDPIAGLTGSEVFTISVKKLSGTIDVAIDLSQVSGPLNLDNIADYINQELSNAGVVSKIARVRIYDEAKFEEEQDDDNPTPLPSTFGFEIQGVSTETLSFNAAATEPAIYIGGTTGIRDTEQGKLIKLTDLASGTPTVAGSDVVTALEEETNTNVVASAIDSEGHVYVLGNSDGSLGSFVNQGEQDVFLRKYDSTGAMIWQQMLGATESAEGFGLAIDGDDNIVVVGQVEGDLTSSVIGGSTDTFVTKYDKTGQELFTQQISPTSSDGARDVAIAADGSIFLTGYTNSAYAAGETYGGGSDGYVTKLNADGTLAWHRQFGGAGEDVGEVIAVDTAGDIFVASREDGNVVVTKYSGTDDTSAALWSTDLGAIGNGQIGALAVDGGKVYLAGSTDQLGFGSSVLTGHSGDMEDGFLVSLNDGAGGAVDFTTFVSGGDVDRISDVKVSQGQIYVVGETRGDVSAAGLTGSVNGFVASYDTGGSQTMAYQFAGAGGYAKAESIVVDEGGGSVLDLLGLARGEISYSGARTITANSTVRAGQYFYLSVDGGRQQKISIDDDETFRSLTFKINAALGLDGKAKVRRSSDGDSLRIEVNEGVRVDLTAGADGFDALAGLGIKVSTIYDDGGLTGDSSFDDDEPKTPIFGLGLETELAIGSKTDAAYALEILSEALSQVRDVYREITKDPALEELLAQQSRTSGPVPAYLTAQLANYQAGLSRLYAGGSVSLYG